MGFFRRADGTSFGEQETKTNKNDLEWEKIVLGVQMDYTSCFDDYYDYDFTLFEKLWGTYQGECPHLTKNFDESFFYRK